MQFGRESAWGTEVNATHRLPIIRESLSKNMAQVRRTELNNSSLFRPGITNVMELVQGQVELYLSYEALNLFWDGAFGTATYGSNGGTTTGTNPYTHVFIPRLYHNSFTIEILDGLLASSDKCKLFTGSKITGFTIRAEAGSGDAAIARLTLDIVAKRMQTTQTPTAALTSNQANLVLASHLTTFDDGTADATNSVRSVEVSMKSGLIYPRPNVGSFYSDEPIRTDYPVCTMKFMKERQSVSLMDAYDAGTSMDPNITFASSPRSLKFEMAVAKVVDLKEDTDGYGIQMQDVTYEAIDGGSSFDLKCTAVNAQSTITT